MKVLLVQTSFLGDVILSTPVIAGLKKVHPDARLWIMTTRLAADLVRKDPLLEGVVIFDKHGADSGVSGMVRMAGKLRRMKFDLVYSLHRSARTALLLAMAGLKQRIGFREAKFSFLYQQRMQRGSESHEVLRNMKILGSIESLSNDCELRLFAPELNELSREYQALAASVADYALLVPGSVWKTKMWRAEGYRKVAEYFIGRGRDVVVSGARGEEDVCRMVSDGLNVLNVAGRISIPEAMHLAKNASIIVCNDSMALHLASAFKVPAVAVFCATSPAFGFGPWRNLAVVVEKEGLTCKPCARHGSQRCPTGTEACMRGLDVEQVIAAIKELQES